MTTSTPERTESEVPTVQLDSSAARFVRRTFGGTMAWILAGALAAAVIVPFAVFYARAFEDGGAPIRSVLQTPGL